MPWSSLAFRHASGRGPALTGHSGCKVLHPLGVCVCPAGIGKPSQLELASGGTAKTRARPGPVVRREVIGIDALPRSGANAHA